MSASSPGCSGASITQPRISPPAAVSAPTSSTSSDASRSKIRWCRSLCAMKALNASAVVANPPGTETPSPDSSPIISPSEEFLPPTWARSVRRRSFSQRMLAVKAGVSMGGAQTAILGAGRTFRSGAAQMTTRPVFYVSHGTGIPHATIGHSLLTQFGHVSFATDRLPFVDTPEKARLAVEEIRKVGEEQGKRPIVVNSCVDSELNRILAESGALMLDIFEPFIAPLEQELGAAREPRVGRAHGIADFDTYH